jgi:hypothetical protein
MGHSDFDRSSGAAGTTRAGKCRSYHRIRIVDARPSRFAVRNDSSFASASTGEHANHLDPVGALTLGAIRRVGRWSGLETGLGVNASAYAVPGPLRAAYGAHPFSFQLFVQIRPHVGSMGPMWNMRMAE